jgi:hypothetical protein
MRLQNPLRRPIRRTHLNCPSDVTPPPWRKTRRAKLVFALATAFSTLY